MEEKTMQTSKETTNEIRRLNDRLRCQGVGGRILITQGIDALGTEIAGKILAAVAAFDAFGPDNDPYGEHDCASINVDGQRIIWKIDYYDMSLAYGSPDPADPSVTRRVMTVMLAEEY